MKKHYFVIFILSCMLFLIAAMAAAAFGSVKIPLEDTYKVGLGLISGGRIYSSEGLQSDYIDILTEIRYPRIVMGALVGASLSLVGVLMQSITRNDLSDPYVLGISSGASAGAVAIIVIGFSGSIGSISIPMGAFLGAIVSTLLVFMISNPFKGVAPSRLILAGVAVSSIFSAITTFLITFAGNDNKVRNAVFWTIGSLSGSSWTGIRLIGLALVITLLTSYFLCKELDGLSLGEDSARIVGMDTQAIRLVVLVISTLLTGFVVSQTGIIGFVGLVIPHICRFYTGQYHKRLIPLAIIWGGIFMMITDAFARTILSPMEVPIGVITAFVGGPVFIWLISKKSKSLGV